MTFDFCAYCDSCDFAEDSTHYEIHVTVDTKDRLKFLSVSRQNNIKPVVIEYTTPRGKTNFHAMSSQRFVGDGDALKAEVSRIIDTYRNAGFLILRVKIETGPAHDTRNVLYHEGHVAVELTGDQEVQFRKDAASLGLHVSRNPFKKTGEHVVMMATERFYEIDTRYFLQSFKKSVDSLNLRGYSTKKIITENVVLDTNLALDDEWIGKTR